VRADPDWLWHHLAIGGAEAPLRALQQAAAGAGIIPWPIDFDSMEEDLFLRLVAAPPAQRGISVAGARILAGQLRDAAERRHQLALARVGQNQACPFDLHALLPVPPEVLALGSEDARAIAWLQGQWGTTAALRHVTSSVTVSGSWLVRFWAADWSPWQALLQLRRLWPDLRFELQPRYTLP
jgi:hypothetical protein